MKAEALITWVSIIALLITGSTPVHGGPVLSPWQFKSDMVIPVHGFGHAVVGGCIFAVGGQDPGSSYGTNHVQKYDPATDIWVQITSMPTARHSLNCAVVDGYIYAIGGHVGNSRSENERYDPSTNTWQSMAPKPTPVSWPGIAAFGDKIYTFGGNRYGSKQSIIEVYDPQTNTWQSVGNMPAAGEPKAAATLGDKIYLAGGYFQGQATDHLWSYDPATGLWDTSLPSMNFPRGVHELVVVGDYLFAIGGSPGPLNSVEWWRPGEQTWTLDESMNVARGYLGAQAVGNTVYAFGGTNSGTLASTESAVVSEPACGWIAFVAAYDGDPDIWAVRPDGTGLKQLTDLPGDQYAAQWSPDSTKIVYPSPKDAQIWVYDWLTGDNTKIYDAHDYEGQDLGVSHVGWPSWSPDGTKILFHEDVAHITVINADGTGRQVVPVESGYVAQTSWSPTGTAFVYSRRNSGLSYSSDLWIYDFTPPLGEEPNIMNGSNHRLTAGAGSESTTKYAPDWTPSGDILFSWGHNIAILEPGESPYWNGPISDPLDPNVSFLTSDGTWPSLVYGYPSWSPDLSQVVYDYWTSQSPEAHLWIMDASGHNRYQLPIPPGSIPDWGNPPPPGPIAYWSFDNPADPGHDDSGNGHDGTLYGDVSAADGICGKGLYFDGNGDYVGVPDADALDPVSTQEITIAAWVNISTYEAQNSSACFGIVGKTVNARPNGSYIFGILNNRGVEPGKLEFTVATGGTPPSQDVYSSSLVPLNDWVHLAVTHNSSNITKIYINGGVDTADSSTITQAFEDNDKGLNIGYSGRYADYFYGSMDEVRFYDRALSACEIKELIEDCGQPRKVSIDIKPQSCPNPLNVKSKGNICVAILGTEEFDASNIDPASIRLKYGDDSEGIASFRSSLEDVATPVEDGNECECNEDGSDGHTDLTVKFDTQLVLAVIGDVNNGDVLQLDLTGVLNDGTAIQGTDCMVVVGNFKAFKKGDINKDGITDTIDFTLMAETWLESTIIQEE